MTKNDLKPLTGMPAPQYDANGTARESAARSAFDTIFIAYPPQTAILERIEGLRLSTRDKRGEPLPGLRLSQVTSAGKSKVLKYYKQDLARRMSEAALPVNPYQVVYISLRKFITVKMLYQRILEILGDPHWKNGTIEILIMRAESFLRARAVEIMIVDEVQHLARSNASNDDVTEELKSFLDAGHVPLVLAGNEDSEPFFLRNSQLVSRLGAPLELTPVDRNTTAGATLFKSFCADLDTAMVRCGATREPSSLDKGSVLEPMLRASGGHAGRVCRIVATALEHSARRNADFVERHDLSVATRTFAIPAGYTESNPFEIA